MLSQLLYKLLRALFLENVIFKEKYILWNTCSSLVFTICKEHVEGIK